ncbi:apoptosis-antagonizing transcription factor [Gautieria morchelliformis]|nr:apoptosis-antagonizing transcription factor [Gautieria morchelliformis]
MQRLTLAQQIAQLESTVPSDFDPEDTYGATTNGNVRPANDEDADMDVHDPDAGREHYVDVGPSEIRKLHDSVADPKYDGVKTSRHQLHASEDDNEQGDLHESSQSGSYQKEGIPSVHVDVGVVSVTDTRAQTPSAIHITTGDSLSSATGDEEAHSPMTNGATKSNQVSARQKNTNSEFSSKQADTLSSSLQRTRVADKLKGRAVSRQLKIWDSLVDARIRLQKAVTAANKLPHPEHLEPYVSTAEGRVAVQRFLTETLTLSEEIAELRHTLLAQAGSVQPPRKKRRVDADQEDLDLESLVEESTAELVRFDAQTHPYTLSTLQKWSAKVQAVAPSALLPSSRTAFKSGPAHIKSAAELVEDALREQDKAVKRTWGKVGDGARIGGTTEQEDESEGDKETFDDREFYQAMLRDVIESKGGRDGLDVADLYANSKRHKKRKIVDTKASKGRKLRYEPHDKLQNFMVPVPVRDAWHEEQIDELFASLLGKGFEDDEPVPSTNILATGQKEGEEMQGFRIFG